MKIKERIELLLHEAFEITELTVIDNSHLHAGHVGAKPEGETHFKLKIQADALNTMSRIKAHQAIFKALDSIMNNPIHALEIKLQDNK